MLDSAHAFPTPMSIGVNIRRSRQRRGLTLAALGAQVGLTKGGLSRIERGLSESSITQLARIADALGVSAATLLGVK